jgi:hypothetical protein
MWSTIEGGDFSPMLSMQGSALLLQRLPSETLEDAQVDLPS